MLDRKSLAQIATNKLIEIFGRKYLQDNYANTCKASGMVADNVFQLFVGIKSDDDLPGRKAYDHHGWVVFGKVLVNAITGEIVDTEYVLE